MRNRLFPGKLLLFGEYTLLAGSRALAMPLRRWQGKLSLGSGNTPLAGFGKFCLDQTFFNDASGRRLRSDLEQGLTFVSDIPQGYGVGSSGAL
ncbi:MAG: mevalonate kinase, partial [Gammaproteobacteria bacterium]